MPRKKNAASASAMTPLEVRRIRERLGLTQAEAGELLGGGVRAFQKYESGTIAPAASVVNLLRLLDADPSALATLTGAKTTPLDASGLRPFEVSAAHVAALSPRKLTTLVRRLATAEVVASGISADSVQLASNITAADAGEDARVEWSSGPSRTEFLPARRCSIQIKASQISPSEAARDITDRDGKVEAAIAETLKVGGCYLLLCSRPYTKNKIELRERSMQAAAQSLSPSPNQLRFYDADRLADWVNRHPSVATWVLEQTQPGQTAGFESWNHWAGRHEHESSEFIDDPRLHILEQRLLPVLRSERAWARVVGLSGIGKSRLTLELLGRAKEPALAELVMYADAQAIEQRGLLSRIQAIADSALRAVLVIDRCEQQTHQDIVGLVSRVGSRLSLVTIDHEIPDHLDSATILVPKADDVVIEQLLDTTAPGLNADDVRRLRKFSDGHPLIAIRAAIAARADNSALPVSDQALVDRIVLGRQTTNDKLRKTAELFSLWGVVATPDATPDEYSFIASMASRLTAEDVHEAVVEMTYRSLFQKRGRLITVQPRPIALALAKRAWEKMLKSNWDRILFPCGPAGMAERAARQLSLLNTDEISLRVAANACRIGGPFDSLEALCSEEASRVISYLAEVDAPIVTRLLSRILANATSGQLLKIRGGARRNLVWSLQKLAFVPETFVAAADLMRKLASAENEKWGNNATGCFESFFPVLLGDTAADGPTRLSVLDGALKDSADSSLALKALLSATKVDHFSRSVGPEQHGLRPPLQPWHPTRGEAHDYLASCLERLTAIALRDDTLGNEARSALGNRLRSLMTHGLADQTESTVRRIVDERGPLWPEATSSLGDALVYDAKGPKEHLVPRIQELLRLLTPENLDEKIEFLISKMPWDWPCEEDIPFEAKAQRQSAAVRELAVDLLQHRDILLKAVPALSRGSHRMAWTFGEALGEMSAELRAPIVDAYLATAPADRNECLMVGYFCGRAKVDPDVVAAFKKEAVSSTELANTLGPLCWGTGISAADVLLVRQGLQKKTIRPFALRQWATGGVLAKRAAPDVQPLFDALFELDAEGFSVGLDLLGMYAFQAKERLNELRPQVRKIAANLKRAKGGRSQMDSHHLEQILAWALSQGRSDADARFVALELGKRVVALAEEDNYDATELIKPLLPRLLAEYGDIVWPLISSALVDTAATWRFEQILGDDYSFDGGKNPALLSLGEEALLAWCYAKPEVGPAFTASIAPLLVVSDGAPTKKFHPLVRRIIDEFGEREDVQDALSRNMGTFGWSGSVTTYYAQFQEPVQELVNHPKPAVRAWAQQFLREVESSIEFAQQRDDEQATRWE